jgi:hypothetical protein
MALGNSWLPWLQCYAAVREIRTDKLLGLLNLKLEIPFKLYQGCRYVQQSVDSTPSGVTISQ